MELLAFPRSARLRVVSALRPQKSQRPTDDRRADVEIESIPRATDYLGFEDRNAEINWPTCSESARLT